jgi:hypothetical protein
MTPFEKHALGAAAVSLQHKVSTTMKTRVTSLTLAWLLSPAMLVRAQSAPPQTPAPQPAASTQSSPAAPQAEPVADIYESLWKVAADDWAVYAGVRGKTQKTVEGLLNTKKCQTDRVAPLIGQAVDALNQWYPEEALYWQKWRENEAVAVQRSAKELEDYKLRQAEAAELKGQDEDDLARLQKQFDDFDKGPKDPEIRRRADALQTSIKQKRADIDDVQKQYDDLTEKIKDLEGNYTTRLVQINANLREASERKIAEMAIWDGLTTRVEQVCGAKKPTIAPASPPKGGKEQQ